MSIAKEDKKYHLFLFLFTPILGLIYALKSGSKSYIRWSIFVFTVIYGSLFHESFLGDGAVHWENVYSHYLNLGFDQFWDELKAMLALSPSEETNDEPYIHILSYLVGTVFSVPRMFFVAVAIVYAYFYSGTIVKILSYVNWNSRYNKFYFTFFLILFVLWLPPLRMQTVRTWTGMWILLYAVISYYETRKLKYLILAFVPPFVHIGFLALAFPIWVVLLTGYRNPKIYFILFITSMLVSNFIARTGFNEFVSQTEVGASKVDGYYVDDEVQERKSGSASLASKKKTNNARFYRRAATLGLDKFALSGLIIFIFLFLRQLGFGKIENTLFSYGLAMASFSNFFTQIFAVHNRGWEIAGVLILGLVVIFLSKQNLNYVSYSFLKVRLPLFLFTVIIIPYFLYLLSNLLSFTSPYVLVFPIAFWINPEIATTIRGVIGLFM